MSSRSLDWTDLASAGSSFAHPGGMADPLAASSAGGFLGKTLVFLRTSSTARIESYEHLQALGLTLIMIHPFKNDAFAHCIDHWVECDTHDVDVVEAHLRRALEKLRIREPDGITSFDEYGVYPATVLAERFRRIAMPFGSAAVKENNIKSEFRKMCAREKLPSPGCCWLLEPGASVAEAVAKAKIEFPVVAKPSPGAGSILAKKCESLAELEEHVALMWPALVSHRDAKHFAALGTKCHILIEEFIGGQEVDIDCVIEKGVVRFAACADNFEPVAPYFSELGGITPSQLEPSHLRALRDALDAFVAVHGQAMNGVLHFEAKYDFDRQGAYIIEANLRMGSAETTTMVATAYSVQLCECVARLALGMPLDNLPPMMGPTVAASSSNSGVGGSNGRQTPPSPASAFATAKVCCASVNIYAPGEGRLSRVEPPLPDAEGYVAALVQPKIGDEVALPPKSFACMAWMVAKGSNGKQALERIQSLTEQFKVTVE